MPVLPIEDFSGLLSAIGQQGEARGITFKEDFDDLQQKEKTRQAVAGAIEGVGQIAGNLFKQAQTETGKKRLLDFNSAWQQKLNESVLNGKTSVSYGEDGKAVLEVDPDLDQWYHEQRDAMTTGIWSPEVKDWLTGQADSTYLSGRDQAVGLAAQKAQADYQTAFKSNLSTAVDASISQKDTTAAFAQIDANPFLTPKGREALKADTAKSVNLGIAKNDVVQTVQEKGYAEGLALANSKGYEGDDKVALLSAAAGESDRQTAAAQGTVKTVFSTAQEQGQSPVAAREKTLAAIPAAYREGATASWDKLQSDWAHNKFAAELNQVSTLDGLLALRQKIAGNEDGRYEAPKGAGTWDQQRVDLTEIDSKLAFYGGGKSKEEDAARSKIADTFELYKQGKIDFYEARKVVTDWGNQAGADYQTKYMGMLREEIPEGMKPLFDNLPKVSEAAYRERMGYKPNKALSSSEMSELSGLQSYINGLAFDLVHESKAGTSPADIQKRLTQAEAIYYSKEYDLLRNAPKAKGGFLGIFGGQTEDQALSRFLGKMESGADKLGDMVYQDENGTTSWAPGYEDSTKSAYDALQARAEKAVGRPLVFTLEQDGLHDVGPSASFVDTKSGTAYRYESTKDGKGITLMEQKKGEGWKAYPLPAAPAHAPKPAPNPVPVPQGGIQSPAGASPSVNSYNKKRYGPSDTGATDVIQDKKTRKYLTWNPARARWEDADGNPVDVTKE